MTVPPLRCGEILRLGSGDYKFGTLDPLRLEVVTVVQEHVLVDGLWIEVVGVTLCDNGFRARQRPYTLVRASAIEKARRAETAAGGRPGC